METTQLIEKFYTCFGNKDYKGMQDCYADDAQFSDPVFGTLSADQVKAMWEMLIKRAPDLEVTFRDVTEHETHATAHWTARYTFSTTGKKVVNEIDASFVCMDGKILKHDDTFSFYNWAKQALGLTGLLLGGTDFLRHKISTQARTNLENYMKKI